MKLLVASIWFLPNRTLRSYAILCLILGAGGAAMKLSSEQTSQFDRDGYLFFPSLFTAAEIKALTDEVPALYAQRRPENVREKTGDVVRTNFAAHLYSYPFAKLARHPRMVEPIQQIFGESVYMHQ